MTRRSSTALVLRAAADLVPARELDRAVTSAAQRLIAAAADGSLRPKHAKHLRSVMAEVTPVVDDIVRIAERGNQLTRSSAQLTHDIEQLATSIDDFVTKRAENDVKRADAEARREKAAAVARMQSDVQLLTAQVQRAELRARLDALEAPRKEAAKQAKAPLTAPPQRVDRVQAALDAKADAARQKNDGDAARIVRDVQIGAVAADEAHPYHAYAGCVYLAAKLDDGLTGAEAADRAREAVLAVMLDADPSPEEIATYYTAFLELRQRTAAATKRREATELFAAAEALAGGVQ